MFDYGKLQLLLKMKLQKHRRKRAPIKGMIGAIFVKKFGDNVWKFSEKGEKERKRYIIESKRCLFVEGNEFDQEG